MADFPLEIFDTHAAIIGMSGSGKSYLARTIVEAWLTEKKRVCIVDPTDVWWGLRSDSVGTGPGYGVIVFGGDHADVPIGSRSGERLGEIVASRNVPAIISPANMTGGERHQFMTDFLNILYTRNRAALHLVLDEADELAPQNPLPETRRMLGAVDRIVRRGRSRGFRALMITQRPAVLHNNVLAMAKSVAVLQLTLPHDRQAFERWMKGQADPAAGQRVLKSLASLHQGEGWLWAPSQGKGVLTRMRFPLITTYDSMRTPEHGEEVTEPTTLAPVELGDLRALLEDEEPAGSTANERPKSYAADLEAAEQRGYERGHERGLLDGRAALARTLLEQLPNVRSTMASAVHEVGRTFTGFMDALEPLLIEARSGEGRKPIVTDFPRPVVAGNGEIRAAEAPRAEQPRGQPELRILQVLAARPIARFTPRQWATLAGMKHSGGTWRTYVSRLRTARYLDERDGTVGVSQKGLEAAGEVDSLSVESVMEQWKRALGSGPSRMIDALRQVYPRGMTRDSLATVTGITDSGGTFRTYLSKLRSNGLVEVANDRVTLTSILAEES